jgi:hypothetical protein
MEGHFAFDAPDMPSVLAHAQAKIRLLPSYQFIAIATSLLERSDAHKCITAASAHLTHRDIPFAIALGIVEACLRKTLAPPPEHHRELWIGFHRAARARDPFAVERAIPVDELDIGDARPLFDQTAPSRIARTGSCKTGKLRQIDNDHTMGQCQIDAAICRT